MQNDFPYKLLFENHPQPMWVYDIESTKILTVNDAAVMRYGYSVEEFRSLSIADLRPGEDVPLLLKSIAESPPGLENSGIWRHRLKDGRVIHVEIASHGFMLDGRPLRLVMATDVTDQVNSIKLKESEAAIFEDILGLLSSGAGLAEVLTQIALVIERLVAGDLPRSSGPVGMLVHGAP